MGCVKVLLAMHIQMGFTTSMGASLTLAEIERTHKPFDAVQHLDGHARAHRLASRYVSIDASPFVVIAQCRHNETPCSCR